MLPLKLQMKDNYYDYYNYCLLKVILYITVKFSLAAYYIWLGVTTPKWNHRLAPILQVNFYFTNNPIYVTFILMNWKIKLFPTKLG